MAGISQGRSVSIGPGEGYESDSVSIPSNGVSAGGFNPADLFFYGEQGAWYDPSDLTTMFQDRAGTTPVTADGQTVGLILDKSKGLVLGPEMVANGDFSSGTTGWASGNSAILTVSAEELLITNGTYGYAYQSVTTVVGKTYRVSTSARIGTASSIALYAGTAPGNNAFGSISTTSTTTVNLQLIFTATYTTSYITLILVDAAGGSTGYIDDVVCNLLPGNHAVAPSDAARPLYKTDGTYHWLQFDGVDDSLSTEAIDFNSNGKLSVFFGSLQNLSNSYTSVFNNGGNSSGDTGKFMFAFPDAANSAKFYTVSLSGLNAGISALSAGKKVSYGFFDYYGATVATTLGVRVNSVNGSNPASTFPQGNNIAISPLYIGAPNSNAGIFVGNIYSLIVRGALSTTDEITETETWVNGKTGAY